MLGLRKYQLAVSKGLRCNEFPRQNVQGDPNPMFCACVAVSPERGRTSNSMAPITDRNLTHARTPQLAPNYVLMLCIFIRLYECEENEYAGLLTYWDE